MYVVRSDQSDVDGEVLNLSGWSIGVFFLQEK